MEERALLGRPTWATVDLTALAWNFRQVRRLAGASVRILAIVKANAYGHGAVACSQALAAAGADGLGVATTEEGIELRQNGIRIPIVVLGLTQATEAKRLLQYDLQPTVASREQILNLSQAAITLQSPVALQVKVDTGMGRIGFQIKEISALAQWLKKVPRITLQGVFTHFAHADGRDKKLLQQQQKLLEEAVQLFRRAGWNHFWVHAANSAAVIESPEVHYDMVRPGLMLYGLYPAERFQRLVRLRPVLSWRTRIIQLKNVPKKTGLSYGHTFVTKRLSRIATLAVGYADGYSRRSSNLGKVLVRGTLCPIVGRVCMDMCLADVTSVSQVKVGDEVILIGPQGNKEITADDLAQWWDTIAYEVVCAIGSRVPRVFRGAAA